MKAVPQAAFLLWARMPVKMCFLYQVEMLASNPNKNILPLDIRQKDAKYNFYYNITSKLALSQYLKRNKLKGMIYKHIQRYTKTILSAKDYLLSDRSFILNEDYIL